MCKSCPTPTRTPVKLVDINDIDYDTEDFSVWSRPDAEINVDRLRDLVAAASHAAGAGAEYAADHAADHAAVIGYTWASPRAGNLPKRIARYVKKRYGKTVPETHMGKLSQVYSEVFGGTITARFSRNFNYSPGKWGEAMDSCWWNKHTGARPALYDAGGYSFQYRDAKDHVGRCWFLIPDGEKYAVIFNAYGPLGLGDLAYTLAHNLGLNCLHRYCVNGRTYNGLVYVNSGSCWIIGHADDIYHVPATVDLYVDTKDYDIYRTCDRCDRVIDEDDAITPNNGGTYCTYCYDDMFWSCSACGSEFAHDDDAPITGDCLCEYCAERRGYSCCSVCSTWCTGCHDGPDGVARCADCHAETVCECHECGADVLRADAVVLHADLIPSVYSLQTLPTYCSTDCRDGHPITRPAVYQQLSLPLQLS